MGYWLRFFATRALNSVHIVRLRGRAVLFAIWILFGRAVSLEVGCTSPVATLGYSFLRLSLSSRLHCVAVNSVGGLLHWVFKKFFVLSETCLGALSLATAIQIRAILFGVASFSLVAGSFLVASTSASLAFSAVRILWVRGVPSWGSLLGITDVFFQSISNFGLMLLPVMSPSPAARLLLAPWSSCLGTVLVFVSGVVIMLVGLRVVSKGRLIVRIFVRSPLDFVGGQLLQVCNASLKPFHALLLSIITTSLSLHRGTPAVHWGVELSELGIGGKVRGWVLRKIHVLFWLYYSN